MRTAEESGDPRTWETARALGKQLIIPVGPYEPRVPTAEEMNAVLPYLLDRATTFYEPQYYCANAEIALANLLGMNVPRQGFPKKTGFSRHGFDWEGYNKDGYNMDGFNREGFNYRGVDKDGYDREGYNYDGFDREGFNRKGKNYYGHTREQAVAEEVDGWSDDWAAAVAALIATTQGIEVIEPPKKAAKKVAPKKVVVAKKVARKAVAPKKAPPRKLAAVG